MFCLLHSGELAVDIGEAGNHISTGGTQVQHRQYRNKCVSQFRHVLCRSGSRQPGCCERCQSVTQWRTRGKFDKAQAKQMIKYK